MPPLAGFTIKFLYLLGTPNKMFPSAFQLFQLRVKEQNSFVQTLFLCLFIYF